MPTRTSRWCCYNLKLEPLIRYTKLQPPPRLQITGLRIKESTRRMLEFRDGQISQLEWRTDGSHYLYSPIFFWEDSQVEQYVIQNSLELNPCYSWLGSSGECACGVYLSPKQLQLIAARHPEFLNRFVQWEFRSRVGGSAFYDYKSRRRIYASELLKASSSLKSKK